MLAALSVASGRPYTRLALRSSGAPGAAFCPGGGSRSGALVVLPPGLGEWGLASRCSLRLRRSLCLPACMPCWWALRDLVAVQRAESSGGGHLSPPHRGLSGGQIVIVEAQEHRVPGPVRLPGSAGQECWGLVPVGLGTHGADLGWVHQMGPAVP
ncbi:hypothetical protein NDU88_010928 [Pleurodeles waltl]|uniref:Uncharacterized protein n=1 Tax=Pleurodeles waltl TaxID=8319 RepID=A0AAV7PWB1_PLEWA|nr:hypothetical protein NDU88_010928 [Pleurodeles waltl]